MVPILMELGVGPDLTRAAYRVGDSSTNIIWALGVRLGIGSSYTYGP